LLRLQSESGHDETGDNGDGSAEAGSTGDGNGGGGASSRGSRLGGVDGNNGVALSRGVGRVGVDGRSSRAGGSGSTVAGDRGGLDNRDEGGGRLGGVARDGQGLLNGDDGGVGTGSAVDLRDRDSLGTVVGGEGSGAIIAVGRGLVGGLGSLGGSGLVGASNLEGVGVLEDLGVALQLDNETVDVLVTEGSINSPAVSLSVVGDTSGNVLDGDLGVLGVTTDQGDGDELAGVLGGSIPGDLEALAGGNGLPSLGLEDGVEVGGLGESLGSESQEGGGGDGELHFGEFVDLEITE